MDSISFFYAETDFVFTHSAPIIEWILRAIQIEGKLLTHLNFIFCSDLYLLKINQEHLAHDYYTDIITFDTSLSKDAIEGDVFISVDRVRENAHLLSIPFFDELNRVIIHGVLHLIGYDDTTPESKFCMRNKEDSYLNLLLY